MSSRKRKLRSSYQEGSRSPRTRRRDEASDELEQPWGEGQEELEYDPALRVIAHEADIVRGPRATYSADALEVEASGRVGDGLIRLGWNVEGEGVVWVDRYDARLLLDEPPNFLSTDVALSRPTSPGGWTDLPSDAEDTFFLSPDETEDYVRVKRRRQLEKLREERMRAMADDEIDEGVSGERWGGSDEEPDDAQTAVMRRTASHLLATANGAHLEMRILANHGADPRFAFLRGRWARAWARIKAHARLEKGGVPERKEPAGLGGLMGYADSEEGSEQEGDAEGETSHEEETVVRAGVDLQAGEEAAKEARRARAREWAAQRRAAKTVNDNVDEV